MASSTRGNPPRHPRSSHWRAGCSETGTSGSGRGPLEKGLLRRFLASGLPVPRAAVGYRWAVAEDTVRMEAALRAALAARGLPDTLYFDNGAAFVNAQLLRACAVLGIRLVHSRPGRPQGRGKVERFFRTVREQFLVELDHHTSGRGGPGAA